MSVQITLGGLSVDVQFKDIKNVHLVVHPPSGRVTISAPVRMDVEAIRAFALTKLGWIRQQQRKLQGQSRETQREFLERESHFIWGRRYLLRLLPSTRGSSVELGHRTLTLRIQSTSTIEVKAEVLARWYRAQIRAEASRLLHIWSPRVGVTPTAVRVQRMKTKWGSCNRRSGSVLLNTDLAKKPKECLEYVLVHELVHLLEPKHDERFKATMNRLMPNWRLRRDLLNELPVGHQDWKQ